MIWLLRHGEAEDDAADDASRKLTEKGRRQAESAGRAMAAIGVELDACLTSPKVRARDTAEIACRELGVEAEETDALRGGEFDIAEVTVGRGNVLLVGHEPDFHRAIQAATGGLVKLRKGGLAAVDGSELHRLFEPSDLERIAGAPGA
ncbi:MAG TPA: histidine phosphatase family protein [Solirubrobacterales bacterium]